MPLPSLCTTTPPVVTRKDCCILSRHRRGEVDHALSLSISLTEPGLFYMLRSVLDWSGAWCYQTTLSRCHPPRYCDSLKKLVVDDGIKTLGLHLCATHMVRSVAHIDSIYFSPSHYCVYRQSNPSKIIYYLCSSKLIEVKVGLLFECVLIGCTVTESKCSRIT